MARWPEKYFSARQQLVYARSWLADHDENLSLNRAFMIEKVLPLSITTYQLPGQRGSLASHALCEVRHQVVENINNDNHPG